MINRVVLVGRLVRDPEVRTLQTGNVTASFTIAVDNYSRDNERSASFIPCVSWGNNAEFASKYFKKGTLVGVDGRLSQRSYDRKDGTKAQVIEIVTSNVQILEPKGADAQRGSRNEEVSSPAEFRKSEPEEILDVSTITDDDLPF